MTENNSGFLHALELDGKGGMQSLSPSQAAQALGGAAPTWVHLDYTHSDARDWLRLETSLEPIVIEALLAEETRPRCAPMGGGLIINLRGVNTNPGSEPEDMVSIRIFCNGRNVISTRQRRLLSVSDVYHTLELGQGAHTAGGVIAELTRRLTARMSEVMSALEDAIDGIEEEIISRTEQGIRLRLVNLRRELIMLRRYLAPQREALAYLKNEKIDWLSERDRMAIREAHDSLLRYLEELDSCRDRAAVIYDEISSRLAEELNSRMWVLSVMAALFLPLGFLTGLFGINVGGMPWADNPYGFLELSLLLVVLLVIQILVFRAKRWF